MSRQPCLVPPPRPLARTLPRRPRRRLPALALPIAIWLAGCTGTAVRDGESAAALGGRQEESPGDLYVQLAAEYLKLGQTEEALTRVNKALEVDRDNAQAHNLVAVIYAQLGQDPLAEKHFGRAVDLQPSDPYILNAYATYLCDRRKFTEAESQYKAALKSPLYATPWITMTNMGTCARRGGKSAEAQSHYEQALKANPRFAPALVALAELEYDRGEFKSAKAHLDNYFQFAQPTPQALLLGVRVERKLGASKRAEAYAELLRRSFPGSPQVGEI